MSMVGLWPSVTVCQLLRHYIPDSISCFTFNFVKHFYTASVYCSYSQCCNSHDCRVRTIPRKPPNTQYPLVLATADTNTQYQYRYQCVAQQCIYVLVSVVLHTRTANAALLFPIPHWLKAPKLIQYKLATVVYRSLNGTAPSYLAADLRRLSDVPSRRRLRSSLTHQLDIRQSQCATVGDRTFATAGARLWNSLPADIVSCDTLPHFRRELKTFLFRQSYPSLLLQFFSVDLAVFTQATLKICNVM